MTQRYFRAYGKLPMRATNWRHNQNGSSNLKCKEKSRKKVLNLFLFSVLFLPSAYFYYIYYMCVYGFVEFVHPIYNWVNRWTLAVVTIRKRKKMKIEKRIGGKLELYTHDLSSFQSITRIVFTQKTTNNHIMNDDNSGWDKNSFRLKWCCIVVIEHNVLIAKNLLSRRIVIKPWTSK